MSREPLAGPAEGGREVVRAGRPILPYSAMFFLSSDNPSVRLSCDWPGCTAL